MEGTSIAERKSISTSVRNQVLARDRHSCQKCGKREKLELHHVTPITDGQDDTADNLLTLCVSCHREWEQLVYPHAEHITFAHWLTIPPALELIAMFAQPWPNNISASEAKEGMLLSFEMARSMR